jgi:uncharacterized coiled-coil protein SlyX
MLTENDLKQIRTIVREVVQEELQPFEKRLDRLEKYMYLQEKRNEGFDMAIQDIRMAIFNLEERMNQRFEMLETRIDAFILRFDRLNGKVLKAGKVLTN